MSADPLAEMLCRADDSMHHHEATDDFPCWHCKQQADAVRAYLASDETVERAARATTGGFANTSGEPDEIDEWDPWDADWWRGQVRAALAAATEARP